MPTQTIGQTLDKRIEEFVQQLPYNAPGPYPSAKPAKPNVHDAELLLDAFASDLQAEMTATAQYINHHFIFGKEPVADLELGIALDEMLHMELLGTLIQDLGVEPRFRRSNGAYWNGGYVAYGGEKCAVLMADIISERAALNGYARLLSCVQTQEAKDLIRRIVADEKAHLHLFEEAYKSSCGNLPAV